MTDDTNDDGDDSSLEDFDDFQADAESDEQDVDAREEAAEVAAKRGQSPQELVESQTPGRGVPELRSTRSEHNRKIRPATPVRDLWGGSWLIVLRKKADTVTEYDRQQPDTQKSLLDYEGSIGTGATEDDAVWACFYLNANNTLAGGRSGPYDFPESRICRYAYDSTDGYDGGRVQEVVRQRVLEQIACGALITGELDEDQVRLALSTAYTPEAADEAMEVAEAKMGDL